MRVPAVVLVLSSDGHGRLTWTCNVTSEYAFTIGYSADGSDWEDYYDGSNPDVLNRDMSGLAGYFRVARTDEEGLVMLPWSNTVYSDGL
jgi:hypothetical protein